MKTSLYIRPSGHCTELYEERYHYTGVKQICGSRSNKDTCQVSSYMHIKLSWWRVYVKHILCHFTASVHYISWNMHTMWMCFALLGLYSVAPFKAEKNKPIYLVSSGWLRRSVRTLRWTSIFPGRNHKLWLRMCQTRHTGCLYPCPPVFLLGVWEQ